MNYAQSEMDAAGSVETPTLAKPLKAGYNRAPKNPLKYISVTSTEAPPERASQPATFDSLSELDGESEADVPAEWCEDVAFEADEEGHPLSGEEMLDNESSQESGAAPEAIALGQPARIADGQAARIAALSDFQRTANLAFQNSGSTFRFPELRTELRTEDEASERSNSASGRVFSIASDVELQAGSQSESQRAIEIDLERDLETDFLQSMGLEPEPNNARGRARAEHGDGLPDAHDFFVEFRRLLRRQKIDALVTEPIAELTEENLSRHDDSWRPRGIVGACVGDGRGLLCQDAQGLAQFRLIANAVPIIEAVSISLGADVAELIARFVGGAMISERSIASDEAPDGKHVRGLQMVHRLTDRLEGGLELREEDLTISTPGNTVDGGSSAGEHQRIRPR